MRFISNDQPRFQHPAQAWPLLMLNWYFVPAFDSNSSLSDLSALIILRMVSALLNLSPCETSVKCKKVGCVLSAEAFGEVNHS